MYRLDNSLVTGRRAIAVVGCGGIGGFVAEGLCRLFRGEDTRIVLVDGDRVEERNLLRQNFYPEDLGRFKSQALAERLSMKFQMPVGYSIDPLANPLMEEWAKHWTALNPGLLVGCVDNAYARSAMAQMTERWHMGWWVDVGNGESFGQVLIGNRPRRLLLGAFDPAQGICYGLPRPTEQRPELLLPPDPAPAQDCAEAVQTGEQSPTINQAMAALTLEVVRRIVEGTCTWMQLSLDLQEGTLRATHASPELVSQITGIRVGELMRPDRIGTRRR